MKKILILGAGEFQVPLIEKAKEMGLHTIVVSPKGPFPGIRIADKAYFFDVREKMEILKIAEKECINGVITDMTDLPVTAAAFIAEKLNLPGIGYKTALLFTNKYLMRERCKTAGIPIVKYMLVNEPNSARDFCRQNGYPAVLKPVDNQGSRGVYKIYNDNEFDKYFKIAQGYSSNNTVLMEEFIDGYEFVIESMFVNNHCRNLIIGDTEYFNIENQFLPKQRLFPSISNPKEVNRALDLNKKIISTFELNQGITHGEYVVDSKTNEIYLLEIAARGGGAYISSSIIPLLTTLDVNRFLLNIALGNKFDIEVCDINDVSAGYIAFYLPEGIITNIEGLGEVKIMEGVEKHNLSSIIKGDLSVPPENKSSRKIVLVKSNNRKNLSKLIEKIKTILKIKVETKEGPKDIIWD